MKIEKIHKVCSTYRKKHIRKIPMINENNKNNNYKERSIYLPLREITFFQANKLY